MGSLALIILNVFMNWRDPLIHNKSWYIYVTGLYHGWSMAEQEEFPPRRSSSRTGALIHWLGMVYGEKRTFAFRSRSGRTQTPAAVCGLGKGHSRQRSPCGVRDGPCCSHCPSHTPSINSVTSLVLQRRPCQQGVAVTLHVIALVGHVGTIQERSVLCCVSAGPDHPGQ